MKTKGTIQRHAAHQRGGRQNRSVVRVWLDTGGQREELADPYWRWKCRTLHTEHDRGWALRPILNTCKYLEIE